MPYPNPPWTLYGSALQTMHLVDDRCIRPLIPAELEIVSVFPGKTLGGVYLATYKAGSTLQYNELIVVGALVRYGRKLGAWISHIYVDNPDSVAGGREIWGLPKQLAKFTEAVGESCDITVWQGERVLCRLTWGKPFLLWQQSISVNSFGILGTDLLLFQAQAALRPGLSNAKLQVPNESPFRSLELGHPWLAIGTDLLKLVVHAPEQVGQLFQDQ